jgi:hypothetical protein
MLKVTNKLGLNAEANEDSIVDAIEQMKNASAEELQALMLEMEQMETAMEALKEKYDAIMEQMDTEKETRLEEDAVEMISNFAKLGRIKNDDENVKMWVNLAKADLNGTKAIIENLPLNVVANKIENKIEDNTKVEFKDGYDFMNFEQKQLNNKNKK